VSTINRARTRAVLALWFEAAKSKRRESDFTNHTSCAIVDGNAILSISRGNIKDNENVGASWCACTQLREATKRSISRNAREVSPRLTTIAMYFSSHFGGISDRTSWTSSRTSWIQKHRASPLRSVSEPARTRTRVQKMRPVQSSSERPGIKRLRRGVLRREFLVRLANAFYRRSPFAYEEATEDGTKEPGLKGPFRKKPGCRGQKER